MKTVSVIIPFYNSEKFLNCLFDCLDRCEFIKGDEIILVNNDSTDSSLTICKNRIRNNSMYRLFTYKDKADSYAARNYGLKYASGDIIAFIDSDCKPTPAWLEEVRKVKIGYVMAGNIILEIEENNIWECYDAVSHLGRIELEAAAGHAATANMAVNRVDFNEVGLFSVRFSGGDYEWSQRACDKGLSIVFNKKALVYHPSRKTYTEIISREKRIAYGVGRAYQQSGKPYWRLKVRYIFRLFKISSYFWVSNNLKKYGVNFLSRVYFVFHLLDMRFQQIDSACKGYKDIDARKLGIK